MQELRDGGSKFHGKGVSKAVRSVKEEILTKLRGHEVTEQSKLDALMIELDGTDNKGRLGGNAASRKSFTPEFEKRERSQ